MKRIINLLIIAIAMVGMLALSSVQHNLVGIIPDGAFVGMLMLELLSGMALMIASTNEAGRTEFWLSLAGVILGTLPGATLFIGLV